MTRTGGINQILSNRLVEFFFNEHELDEIVSDFDRVQREVNLGDSAGLPT
jgi:sugar fermentation stimulation protein A